MLTLDKKNGLKERNIPGARQGVIAALDVGTTKVCCFIAKVEDGEEKNGVPLKVTGFGHQISKGVRKGAVVDLDTTEDAIRAAVEAAERMAGTTLRHVVVNLSAGAPESRTITVGGSVSGKPITDELLFELLRYGRKQHNPEGRTIVHAVPTGYALDDNRGIRDPRGMFGDRLSARIHMVSAATAQIRNLALCIERCHLELAGLVVSPYASGLSCLVDDEAQLGSICIDLGGGITSLSIFAGGNCLHTDVVPLGGAHVTNDIARGLSTPLASAERIKTLYGSALASPTDDREMIDVPQVGEEETNASPNHIPRSLLTGIIQPRLEEIFELVRDRLEASGLEEAAGRRVVLTGGASQMTGVRELAARILEKNVRLARPFRLTGVADVATGPAFSTCAGLLRYAATGPAEAVMTVIDSDASANHNKGRVKRIGRWLKMNF